MFNKYINNIFILQIMFSLFTNKEKIKLIDDDYLESEYVIGSNPIDKKGFFLRDLSNYKLVAREAYITFEEKNKKKISTKLDYYECSYSDNFFFEMNKKIILDENGEIIITFKDFNNNNIITSFKFKINNDYQKLVDYIKIYNEIHNLEIILFLERQTYNDLFQIQKIHIFKN